MSVKIASAFAPGVMWHTAFGEMKHCKAVQRPCLPLTSRYVAAGAHRYRLEYLLVRRVEHVSLSARARALDVCDIGARFCLQIMQMKSTRARVTTNFGDTS